MYKAIRRKDRAMSPEKVRSMLNSFEYGIMATTGENGQPYATPLSFAVIENQIYFHCATEGQKLDNLHMNNRVCFCCVGNTQPVYDNGFSTYYESVIVYGTASLVEEEEEKVQALMALAEKYLPGHMDRAPMDIARSMPKTLVYKISIDHITGKQKIKK